MGNKPYDNCFLWTVLTISTLSLCMKSCKVGFAVIASGRYVLLLHSETIIMAKYIHQCFSTEKMKWEIINTDTMDELVPKPRAGHCAVSVSIYSCCLIPKIL